MLTEASHLVEGHSSGWWGNLGVNLPLVLPGRVWSGKTHQSFLGLDFIFELWWMISRKYIATLHKNIFTFTTSIHPEIEGWSSDVIDVQRESKYYGFFFFWRAPRYVRGSPGGSHGKEAVCNAGDWGLIPESGRSPGEGNGNPLQYSCLENPMDRGAWRATVHGVAKSQTRLSDWHDNKGT